MSDARASVRESPLHRRSLVRRLTVAALRDACRFRRDRLVLRWLSARTDRLVRRTPPVAVALRGDAEVHIQTCHKYVGMTIAAAKSFYRYTPTRFPLVLHDDGSLSGDDLDMLLAHFPGARVISRDESDTVVLPELERRGLTRCAELRRRLYFTIRLFNLPFFAEGRRVLQLDSDVIFLAPPLQLLRAMLSPGVGGAALFNVDVREHYSWTPELVRQRLGIDVVHSFNAGLVLFRPRIESLDLYERALAMADLTTDLGAPPGLTARQRWLLLDQALLAIECSLQGAQALPPEYDVCARLRRQGREDLISEHCIDHQKPYFHRRFARDVYPALRHGMGADPRRRAHAVMMSPVASRDARIGAEATQATVVAEDSSGLH